MKTALNQPKADNATALCPRLKASKQRTLRVLEAVDRKTNQKVIRSIETCNQSEGRYDVIRQTRPGGQKITRNKEITLKKYLCDLLSVGISLRHYRGTFRFFLCNDLELPKAVLKVYSYQINHLNNYFFHRKKNKKSPLRRLKSIPERSLDSMAFFLRKNGIIPNDMDPICTRVAYKLFYNYSVHW